MNELREVLERINAFLDKLERWLPLPPREPDWNSSIAFRWRKRNGSGYIQPVSHPHRIRLKDLLGIEQQKKLIDQNTRQFVQGYPANNVLLTGARGTGKSSLAKAVLNKYAVKGLRLIEVDKHDLIDMPDIVEHIYRRTERFLLFCDDLSFEADEPGYKALKAVLDGSIATASENVLIYATSNRRHLMPEYMQENLATRYLGEEVHPAEAVEEKISFSERFGLWLSFYPFSQDDYLRIVEHWLDYLGVRNAVSAELRESALQWALSRGSRSGR
ncbi:MAG: ATP-binding protein, partial [Burkholderiales bacterium]